MNIGTGFLEAIRDRPDNDTPRLIYADWLEEHGEPARAEFIRVQVQLAGMPANDPRRQPLEDRESDLIAAHELEWLGPPPDGLAAWRFRRGFVEWVCPHQDPRFVDPKSLNGFEALFDRQPVTSVTVRHLLDVPWLERLNELTVNDRGGHGDLGSPLLTSQRLSGLTSLSIFGLPTYDSGVRSLLTRPGASRIEKLGLRGLTDAHLALLLADQSLENLRALELSFPELTRNGQALLTSPEQAGRWVELAYKGLGGQLHSASTFQRLRDCRNLRRLRLPWPRRCTEALPMPASLTHLDLTSASSGSRHQIPAEGLRELARLPRLQQLTTSSVAWDPMSATLAAMKAVLARPSGPVWNLGIDPRSPRLNALVRLPNLNRLRSLTIATPFDGIVTAAELKSLAGCDQLTGLRRLNLRRHDVTAHDAAVLAQAPALVGLDQLDLSQNFSLETAGLKALLGEGGLRRLRSLGLQQTRLDAGCVEVLRAWPSLPYLRWLDLTMNDIDPSALRGLLDDPRLSPLATIYLSVSGRNRPSLGRGAERFGCRLSLEEPVP